MFATSFTYGSRAVACPQTPPKVPLTGLWCSSRQTSKHGCEKATSTCPSFASFKAVSMPSCSSRSKRHQTWGRNSGAQLAALRLAGLVPHEPDRRLHQLERLALGTRRGGVCDAHLDGDRRIRQDALRPDDLDVRGLGDQPFGEDVNDSLAPPTLLRRTQRVLPPRPRHQPCSTSYSCAVSSRRAICPSRRDGTAPKAPAR